MSKILIAEDTVENHVGRTGSDWNFQPNAALCGAELDGVGFGEWRPRIRNITFK